MKSPAFQFYPADWLAEKNIILMSPAEEGAYIRLLSYCWENEGLPIDEDELSILSRLGEGWFKGGSTKLLKCFYQKDGMYQNARLDNERDKQKKWHDKSVEGGKRSAEMRKNNDSKGGSRVVQPKGNIVSPSPSSSSSPKEREPQKKELIAKEEIQTLSLRLLEKFPDINCSAELAKFLAYWTEKNSRGKERWQAQKFFDITRRLTTWFDRVNNGDFRKQERIGLAVYNPNQK